MNKLLGVLLVATAAATLNAPAALATPVDASFAEQGAPNIVRVWDHCGFGMHRTAWGQCVSNYAIGPGMRGCPAGYHIGTTIHGCFPNH